MADVRVRRQVAFLAAQLMYERVESEYFTAKRKAARQLGLGDRARAADLPSNREIRDHVQALARMHEGSKRADRLRAMRVEALRLMRVLARFRPRLIGSVWTGHVRRGSDIDLHVFSDSEALVASTLESAGFGFEIEHKRVIKHGEARTFVHFHVPDRFAFELTLYPEAKVGYAFKSSITGKAMEKASIAELEMALEAESPGADLEAEVSVADDPVDRIELFRTLLQPLERVKGHPVHHPEGDALYHSLQVFELARDIRSYDEEFLLAALLHDVGKAIDPGDHVGAGLDALEGAITDRTATLIAHHMEAHAYRDGTLGARARSRLERLDDFDDLMLLQELDRRGRQPGAIVLELPEVLDLLREFEDEEDDDPEADDFDEFDPDDDSPDPS